MYDHTSIVERILWRCRIMFQLALPYLRYVSPKSVLDFEAEIKLTSLKVEIGVQIRCPFYQPSGSELSRQIVLRQMPGSNQSSMWTRMVSIDCHNPSNYRLKYSPLTAGSDLFK